MITPEQKKEIVDFLFRKNLPLDLLVEVEDHFNEQIYHKMSFENKDFETSFNEIQKDWKKDLELSLGVFSFGKYKTKFQREIESQTNKEKQLRALKYFVPYFGLSIVFLFINPLISKYLIFIVNLLVGMLCLIYIIKDYKLITTGNYNYKRKNISILQKKMIFINFGVQTLIFYVFFTGNKFDKLYEAIMNLPEINLNTFFSLIFPYFYVYCGIVGILYYYDYKKTVKILKNKIDLKL